MLLRHSSLAITVTNVVMTFVPGLSRWCCLALHAAQAILCVYHHGQCCDDLCAQLAFFLVLLSTPCCSGAHCDHL